MNNVAILVASKRRPADQINWSSIGQVVEDIPRLYQLVKEKEIALILADEEDFDIKPAIATKLRRHNGLLEIWKIVERESQSLPELNFIDGAISRDLGEKELITKVRQILETKELLAKYNIVARSAKMKAAAETVRKISPTDVAVLIVGPSGSGKELIAEALHHDSKRSKGPFVAINGGSGACCGRDS